MLIEIKKIPEGKRFFEARMRVGEIDAQVKLETERNGDKISCLAEYETQIKCECARCLREFAQKISGRVRFFVIYEKCGFDDDGEFDCYRYKSENDRVDFTQTLYDDVFLQIPMKTLCDENCAGIILDGRKDED